MRLRVETPEAQGDDSWIVIRKPMGVEPLEFRRLNNIDDQAPSRENSRAMLQLMVSLIEDWNWVDEDGQPLPLPESDPEIADRLNSEELTAITHAVGKAMMPQTDLGNSGSGSG